MIILSFPKTSKRINGESSPSTVGLSISPDFLIEKGVSEFIPLWERPNETDNGGSICCSDGARS